MSTTSQPFSELVTQPIPEDIGATSLPPDILAATPPSPPQGPGVGGGFPLVFYPPGYTFVGGSLATGYTTHIQSFEGYSVVTGRTMRINLSLLAEKTDSNPRSYSSFKLIVKAPGVDYQFVVKPETLAEADITIKANGQRFYRLVVDVPLPPNATQVNMLLQQDGHRTLGGWTSNVMVRDGLWGTSLYGKHDQNYLPNEDVLGLIPGAAVAGSTMLASDGTSFTDVDLHSIFTGDGTIDGLYLVDGFAVPSTIADHLADPAAIARLDELIAATTNPGGSFGTATLSTETFDLIAATGGASTFTQAFTASGSSSFAADGGFAALSSATALWDDIGTAAPLDLSFAASELASPAAFATTGLGEQAALQLPVEGGEALFANAADPTWFSLVPDGELTFQTTAFPTALGGVETFTGVDTWSSAGLAGAFVADAGDWTTAGPSFDQGFQSLVSSMATFTDGGSVGAFSQESEAWRPVLA